LSLYRSALAQEFVPDKKPTSERLRSEAEKLRETATDLKAGGYPYFEVRRVREADTGP
jgi:hypothetical protein